MGWDSMGVGQQGGGAAWGWGSMVGGAAWRAGGVGRVLLTMSNVSLSV